MKLNNRCMGWLPMSAAMALLLTSRGLAWTQEEKPTENQGSRLEGQVLSHFLSLADRASEALVEEPPDREGYQESPGKRDYYMFFVDSYAVRALAAAYDLTGRKRYLAACETWADRMLRHQSGMVPTGAYYMNYHRKPGETSGQWFVADSGSIAMGVLATALRATEDKKQRYLESVRAYVTLVQDQFLRESGGVTDGFWEKSKDEWWCSTALFASAAFQLDGITGEQRHQPAALRAVEWLLGFEYGDTILYTFAEGAPTTIFYILEAYSSALPYLEPGSFLQQEVHRRFSVTAEWIVDRQNGLGTWDYNPDNWGVKLGGLPCHLLVYMSRVSDPEARRLLISPAGRRVSLEQLVSEAAGRALEYFSAQPSPGERFTQQEAFTMMSYAEKLCPGSLYNRTSATQPCRRSSEEHGR